MDFLDLKRPPRMLEPPLPTEPPVPVEATTAS